MRIRFVTLYFPPEVGAAQRRISELARRLAARAHTVTVVTGFPNYPSGEKPPSYRGRLFMKECADAVNVIRLPHFVAPNKGFFKRLLIHLTFALSAGIYTLFMKRDDIVYVESPPLFNGFVGLASKWFRGIPFFFNVADLWPQTAIELGALKNKTVISLAKFLERLFFRQAGKILAITAGVRKSVMAAGFGPDDVYLLTNGVDHEKFRPEINPDPEISAYRPANGILVLYAGTHGLIYSLETILEAADILRNEKMHFVFIGDGADKERIMGLAAAKGLPNITFLPPRPAKDMPGVYKAADLSIISLRNLPVSEKIIPMKSFELMAVGTPILLSARCEAGAHLEKAGNGYVIDPEKATEMARILLEFSRLDNEKKEEMRRDGRQYVIQNFSNEKIASQFESMVLNWLEEYELGKRKD